MTRHIKRVILRSIANAGYVLLKKADYENLLDSAHGSTPTVASAAGPAAARSKGQADFGEFVDFDVRTEFEAFLHRIDGAISLPARRIYSIYSAVRYLARARVAGDLVDCGNGTVETLTVVATALATLGETSRRLVLLDVTGDHRHRPETELALWGTDRGSLLDVKPHRSSNRTKLRPLPDELVASGYPTERILVVRYPVDTIDLAGPIAFLGMTSETYDANRAAFRTLAPRVAIGGVIAVQNDSAPHLPDAAKEFMARCGVDLFFWQVTNTYRVGVKSRPFGDLG